MQNSKIAYLRPILLSTLPGFRTHRVPHSSAVFDFVSPLLIVWMIINENVLLNLWNLDLDPKKIIGFWNKIKIFAFLNKHLILDELFIYNKGWFSPGKGAFITTHFNFSSNLENSSCSSKWNAQCLSGTFEFQDNGGEGPILIKFSFAKTKKSKDCYNSRQNILEISWEVLVMTFLIYPCSTR